MKTRMEKYYGKKDKSATSRSSRNQDVYNDIYTYGTYSNIEGIAEIDKANQVDITKVKEMLKNRENYQKERKYRRLTENYKETETKEETNSTRIAEEKNYDIRDVLTKAKENKEPDDKERVLKNTNYNILKNIDLQRELDKKNEESSEDELKELIETITNTSMLNKINDADLAIDLLSDLKDDDTKIGELNNLKEFIEQETKRIDVQNNKQETPYDKSFFTSSLKLNKGDFLDEKGHNKSSVFKVLTITILIVVVIVAVAILVLKNI